MSILLLRLAYHACLATNPKPCPTPFYTRTRFGMVCACSRAADLQRNSVYYFSQHRADRARPRLVHATRNLNKKVVRLHIQVVISYRVVSTFWISYWSAIRTLWTGWRWHQECVLVIWSNRRWAIDRWVIPRIDNVSQMTQCPLRHLSNFCINKQNLIPHIRSLSPLFYYYFNFHFHTIFRFRFKG